MRCSAPPRCPQPVTVNHWTHNSLQADLAEYLRTTRAMVCWENFQVGPSGSPRPDVYGVPRSYSGFRPLAYECKVAVSDFRRDVTAGKWQAYLKFSCGVIFAVPAGLIDKAEVPAGCGLMVRSDAGWRAVKGPTLRTLPEIPVYCWVKLLIDGIDREAARRTVKARMAMWSTYAAEQGVRKRFGEQVAELVRRAVHSREMLEREISDAEAERETIRAGTHESLQWAAKQAEREAQYLNGELRELARQLGLPEDSGVGPLRAAIARARERLVGDKELERQRRLFSQLQDTLNQATEPLPGAPYAEPTPEPQTTRSRAKARAPRRQ
jgi:hypothetical protein